MSIVTNWQVLRRRLSVDVLALVPGKLNFKTFLRVRNPFQGGHRSFALTIAKSADSDCGNLTKPSEHPEIALLHEQQFPAGRDTDVSFIAQTEPGSSVHNSLWPAAASPFAQWRTSAHASNTLPMRLAGAFGSIRKSSRWFPILCLRAIGVAVQVTTIQDRRIRLLQIATTVLQSAEKSGGDCTGHRPS